MAQAAPAGPIGAPESRFRRYVAVDCVASALGDALRQVGLLVAWFAAVTSSVFAQKVTQNPDWLKKPTAQGMLAVFPRDALRKGQGGKAEISCKVSVQGALFECVIISESPPGAGFGAAAIAMAPQFLMRPMTVDGKPVESRVNIPINFGIGTPLAASLPLTGTRLAQSKSRANAGLALTHVPWIDAPTYAQVVAAYPAKAREAKQGGHAVFNCRIDDHGRPAACTTVRDEPAGFGFEEAARALLKDFRAPAADSQGTPLEGDTTLIPFTFAVEMLSDSRPVIGKPEWESLPQALDMASSFPAAATAGNVTVGHVRLICTISGGGRLTDCSVEQQSPEGFGFDKAALALSNKFRGSLWTDEGLPTVGGRTEVPIRYQPEGAPPPVSPATALRCDLGLRLADESLMSACTAIIDSGVEDTAELATAYDVRAEGWATRGENDKAIADFTRALKLNPDMASALAGRAQALALRGEDALANADIGRAVQLDPTSARVLLSEANIRLQHDDFDGVIAVLTKAVAIRPFAAGFQGLGVAWQGKGDLDKALAAFDRAIDLEPTCHDCYALRGAVWEQKGQPDRGLKDEDESLKLDPGSPEALFYRSVIWMDKRDFVRAMADNDAAIARGPTLAMAYNGRCWLRTISGGDLAEALTDCDKAIRLAPQYWQFFDSRAVVHFKREEYVPAEADEDHALELAPDHAEPLFLRGLAREWLGKRAEGAVDVAKAAAKDPKIAARYAKWGVKEPAP